MRHREHDLQASIKSWVRRWLTTPCVFLAFDRSRATSETQYVFEAARGIRAGTPDTVLLYNGRSWWVELKVGRNSAQEAQVVLHGEMRGVGHEVDIIYTVADYAAGAFAKGLTLHPRAMEEAAALDRKLALKWATGAKDKAAKIIPGAARATGREAKKRAIAKIARLRKDGLFF